MELEEKKIEEEREMAIDELRKNLASETEMLLKAQDSELGLLIGRLQVGVDMYCLLFDQQLHKTLK